MVRSIIGLCCLGVLCLLFSLCIDINISMKCWYFILCLCIGFFFLNFFLSHLNFLKFYMGWGFVLGLSMIVLTCMCLFRIINFYNSSLNILCIAWFIYSILLYLASVSCVFSGFWIYSFNIYISSNYLKSIRYVNLIIIFYCILNSVSFLAVYFAVSFHDVYEYLSYGYIFINIRFAYIYYGIYCTFNKGFSLVRFIDGLVFGVDSGPIYNIYIISPLLCVVFIIYIYRYILFECFLGIPPSSLYLLIIFLIIILDKFLIYTAPAGIIVLFVYILLFDICVGTYISVCFIFMVYIYFSSPVKRDYHIKVLYSNKSSDKREYYRLFCGDFYATQFIYGETGSLFYLRNCMTMINVHRVQCRVSNIYIISSVIFYRYLFSGTLLVLPCNISSFNKHLLGLYRYSIINIFTKLLFGFRILNGLLRDYYENLYPHNNSLYSVISMQLFLGYYNIPFHISNSFMPRWSSYDNYYFKYLYRAYFTHPKYLSIFVVMQLHSLLDFSKMFYDIMEFSNSGIYTMFYYSYKVGCVYSNNKYMYIYKSIEAFVRNRYISSIDCFRYMFNTNTCANDDLNTDNLDIDISINKFGSQISSLSENIIFILKKKYSLLYVSYFEIRSAFLKYQESFEIFNNNSVSEFPEEEFLYNINRIYTRLDYEIKVNKLYSNNSEYIIVVSIIKYLLGNMAKYETFETFYNNVFLENTESDIIINIYSYIVRVLTFMHAHNDLF